MIIKWHQARIIQKCVGEEPKENIIINDLNSYQKLVNGVVDFIPFSFISDDKTLNNLFIGYNTQIIKQHLKDNIVLDNKNKIKGDIFVIGDADGDFISLTKQQAKKVIKILGGQKNG